MEQRRPIPGALTEFQFDQEYTEREGNHRLEGIRTTQRPSVHSLSGIKVLDANRIKQLKTRNLASLKETFERMSGNALKGLDWSNVLLAGGMVLSALTSTNSKDE